ITYKLGKEIEHDIIPIWERELRPNRFELKPLVIFENKYYFAPFNCMTTFRLWTDAFSGFFPPHEVKIENTLKVFEKLKKKDQDEMVDEIKEMFISFGYKKIFKECKLHKYG